MVRTLPVANPLECLRVPNTHTIEPSVGSQLLDGLIALRAGDFSYRLPRTWWGSRASSPTPSTTSSR